MRVKSPVSPLIFVLFSADALLDLFETQKDGKSLCPLTVFNVDSKYYIAAFPKLSFRRKCRSWLSSYGKFIGSGYILEAFLREHGKILHVFQQLLR